MHATASAPQASVLPAAGICSHSFLAGFRVEMPQGLAAEPGAHDASGVRACPLCWYSPRPFLGWAGQAAFCRGCKAPYSCHMCTGARASVSSFTHARGCEQELLTLLGVPTCRQSFPVLVRCRKGRGAAGEAGVAAQPRPGSRPLAERPGMADDHAAGEVSRPAAPSCHLIALLQDPVQLFPAAAALLPCCCLASHTREGAV